MDISQFKNKWSFVTINSSQNKRIISQQNFQIYTITIYKIITTFFLMSENLIELGPVSSSRQTSRLKECWGIYRSPTKEILTLERQLNPHS